MTTIYADFNNADSEGRLRLNTAGTETDLRRLGLSLTNGLGLQLSDGELTAIGFVRFSEVESIWVAEIDWMGVRSI